MTWFVLLLVIVVLIIAAGFVIDYRLNWKNHEQRGFEMKPTSGPSPEQLEREAHNG